MTEEKKETQATDPFSFTVEQTAEALQVSTRTVRDLLAAGEMDECARLVGRTWRISPTRLRNWLRGGKGKKTEAEAEEEPQEEKPDYSAYGYGHNSYISRG